MDHVKDILLRENDMLVKGKKMLIDRSDAKRQTFENCFTECINLHLQQQPLKQYMLQLSLINLVLHQVLEREHPKYQLLQTYEHIQRPRSSSSA